jgi:hypothetical protein
MKPTDNVAFVYLGTVTKFDKFAFLIWKQRPEEIIPVTPVTPVTPTPPK